MFFYAGYEKDFVTAPTIIQIFEHQFSVYGDIYASSNGFYIAEHNKVAFLEVFLMTIKMPHIALLQEFSLYEHTTQYSKFVSFSVSK